MKTNEITKESFNELMFKLSNDLGFYRGDDIMFSVCKEMKANPLEVLNPLGGDNYINESIKRIDRNLVKEMTEEESRIFIAFLMQESGKDMEIDWSMVEEQYAKDTLTKVLSNRCKAVGVKLSKLAGIYISTQLKSLGEVTMCTAYIYWQTKFSEIEEIDMEAIARIFPFGFPMELEWKNIWDKQKVERLNQFESDNMLDYKICYE